MISDYISIDIENPNSRGNSICSIGIVVVKISLIKSLLLNIFTLCDNI